jgi:Family of unknown function (DUF5675)
VITCNVVRDPSTDDGVFGTIAVFRGDGAQRGWHTGELPWRDNHARLSCMPLGTYMARLGWSDHFQRQLYHLQGVPGRDAIEIHNANFCGDVTLGKKSQVLGCMAIGNSVGPLPIDPKDPDSPQQMAVLDSIHGLEAFMEFCQGQDLKIIITGDSSWT